MLLNSPHADLLSDRVAVFKDLPVSSSWQSGFAQLTELIGVCDFEKFPMCLAIWKKSTGGRSYHVLSEQMLLCRITRLIILTQDQLTETCGESRFAVLKRMCHLKSDTTCGTSSLPSSQRHFPRTPGSYGNDWWFVAHVAFLFVVLLCERILMEGGISFFQTLQGYTGRRKNWQTFGGRAWSRCR